MDQMPEPACRDMLSRCRGAVCEEDRGRYALEQGGADDSGYRSQRSRPLAARKTP